MPTLRNRLISLLCGIASTMVSGQLIISPVLASSDQRIIVQSTTSTQNAGFYDHVIPPFTQQTGIMVDVVAVGTGQALKNASQCDADLLIVHARTAEDKFIAAGHGIRRHNLMYNDFVLVGPQSDPADIARSRSVADALRRIQHAGARFASRGDESGTHSKELALWEAAGLRPTADADAQVNAWYLETGSSMGATLNFAVQSDSYALTDRATWLAFANKFQHRILFSGDPRLFNQYGIVEINPAHCPDAAHDKAAIFTAWLLSKKGQQLIAALTRNGHQLFTPNADRTD